jgi:putative hydrolase of the HAD superfamily
MNIQLITFDLDDTLWDTAPVIVSAEAYCANGWRTRTEPGRGAGGASVAIRERVLSREPGLKHRISALRRRVLFHALEEAGYAHAKLRIWPTRV